MTHGPEDRWVAQRTELVARRRRLLAEPDEEEAMPDEFLTLEAFDAELARLHRRYPSQVVPDAHLLSEDGVESVVAVGWPPEFHVASRALKDRLERTNPEGYRARYRAWELLED